MTKRGTGSESQPHFLKLVPIWFVEGFPFTDWGDVCVAAAMLEALEGYPIVIKVAHISPADATIDYTPRKKRRRR